MENNSNQKKYSSSFYLKITTSVFVLVILGVLSYVFGFFIPHQNRILTVAMQAIKSETPQSQTSGAQNQTPLPVNNKPSTTSSNVSVVPDRNKFYIDPQCSIPVAFYQEGDGYISKYPDSSIAQQKVYEIQCKVFVFKDETGYKDTNTLYKDILSVVSSVSLAYQNQTIPGAPAFVAIYNPTDRTELPTYDPRFAQPYHGKYSYYTYVSGQPVGETDLNKSVQSGNTTYETAVGTYIPAQDFPVRLTFTIDGNNASVSVPLTSTN